MDTNNIIMNDSDIVTVKNRSNSVVGYSIPELRIDRTFVKGESKKISMEELRQLSYQPGGQSLLNDYLVIVEKAAVDELVTNLQPEYNYDEAKIKEILTTGSLDELLDTLDFAPEGVIDIIKDISVAIKLNDVEKRNAIKEKTGFDITKALEIKKMDAEDEATKENAAVKQRRTQPAEEPKTQIRRVVRK